MIKEDTENPDKEIVNLIVDLRENSNLVGIDKKSFSRKTNHNDLYMRVLGFIEPLHVVQFGNARKPEENRRRISCFKASLTKKRLNKGFWFSMTNHNYFALHRISVIFDDFIVEKIKSGNSAHLSDGAAGHKMGYAVRWRGRVLGARAIMKKF